MTEDMERVHGAISGQVLQLASIAGQAAELAVQLSAVRARRAELLDQETAARVADRLRTDRELAATVWARSRSRRWLTEASPEELVAVWASARAWAPHDTRAARAVESLVQRVADLGVDPGAAAAALDAADSAALSRMLAERPARAPAGARADDQPTGRGWEDGGEPAGRTWEQREKDVLQVLRGAWEDRVVEAVAAGDAFPALVHKLSHLQDDGHDVFALVALMPAQKLVAPEIRQPAAFAAWMVDQYAAAEPVRVAGQDYTMPAGEGAVPKPATAPPGEPAAVRPPAREREEQRQQ